MAKKDKHEKPEISEKKNKKSIFWIAGAVVAVIAILAISGNLPFIGTEKETEKSFNLTGKETRPVLDPLSGSGNKKGKSFYVQGGETRPVLEPSLFTGQVYAAYAAAREYPEIMDQVYCYCSCDNPPLNHKSLLSCFTDRHGAG